MPSSAADTLSPRACNRATLARQLLLERSPLSPIAAIGHLVGLQAQVPLNPYTALWSRLDGFDPHELAALLVDRHVVRIVVMRGTIHLVTADDCLLLRPLVQPVLDRELNAHREFGPHLRDVDLRPVLAFAREVLTTPHSGPALRRALAAQFPKLDAAALAYACRNHLALVQAPPRGVWGRSAQVTSATAEAWLGRPLVPAPSIDEVVIRYFGAFGPATVADVASWSGLRGMREVVERVRPRLRVFRDERGRELFDLPDAPRPDEDFPAPPRFLPEYDNVLLSHADRSRFTTDETRHVVSAPTAPVHGAVLNDGTGCATWHIERDAKADAVALVVSHAARLAKRAVAAIEREGDRLVRFLEPDATSRDVRVVSR
jgi:hypothetical protein